VLFVHIKALLFDLNTSNHAHRNHGYGYGTVQHGMHASWIHFGSSSSGVRSSSEDDGPRSVVVPNDPDRHDDTNWRDDPIWSHDSNMQATKPVLQRFHRCAKWGSDTNVLG